ncbi:hypothetical protein SGM_2886 [Streptomyces griseoaurantiacus M045]|uniref:Uncharacterized protein n=1 Tax=Streptomyces griseoaurantiacus M045 TaxID=996637 RepID=F3NIC2_9ACTN|nr:hypothetical protein [Streptomyces griseoaurantiacus]EGG46758.1 hypothetical protein SGM_2886 [Streptomyces griseoaurantiacus M045]
MAAEHIKEYDDVRHRIARVLNPLLHLLFPPPGRHRAELRPASLPAERRLPVCHFADGPCPEARRRALERRRERWRAEYADALATAARR